MNQNGTWSAIGKYACLLGICMGFACSLCGCQSEVAADGQPENKQGAEGQVELDADYPSETDSSEDIEDKSNQTVKVDTDDSQNEDAPAYSDMTIQEQLMHGYFANLDETDSYREQIERAYQGIQRRDADGVEWRLLDLNGDGIEDLIMQEADCVKNTMEQRIIGIFACDENTARCVKWDLNDATEFYFCGANGELMYDSDYWGTYVSYDLRSHCYYDRDWKLVRDYDLARINVDSASVGYDTEERNEQSIREWAENHPDMAEDGWYYRRYRYDPATGEVESTEGFTQEEWVKEYEMVTGLAYDVNPYFFTRRNTSLSADVTYYSLENRSTVQGQLEMKWIKRYENGDLYKLSILPTTDMTKAGYLGDARLHIYMYVTSDEIYRLWSYDVHSDERIEFYNDDELLVAELDTDERLIANGELVCSMEDVADELDSEEIGTHAVITHHGNQAIYTRADRKVNGEPGYYETFVWEEGRGLVEYRSGFRAEAEILYLENITDSGDS